MTKTPVAAVNMPDITPAKNPAKHSCLPKSGRTGLIAPHSPYAIRTVLSSKRTFVGLPAESGLSRFLQQRALHHGCGIHHRIRVGSLEDVVNLVIEGVGVAVIPEAAAIRLVKDRAIICPLVDPWATRQLLLCKASDASVGLASSRLFDFLSSDNSI